jgi:hypothetical protein
MKQKARKSLTSPNNKSHRFPRLWIIIGAVVLVGMLAITAILLNNNASVLKEAPEAANILEVQSSMPFQILIPSFLPREFNRAKVAIDVDQTGPGGEPMVQLTYKTSSGVNVYFRQWVPVNPDLEILSGSRPVHTKWGKGWLLTQSEAMVAVWIDVGPLRVSIYTSSPEKITPEQVVQMADSLGPASSKQVFTFVVDRAAIKDVPPPPPFEVPIVDGVQEVTLVVTPGGYTPLRFSVKKDIPVRLTFRMLGDVGCGNELIFPANPPDMASLKVESVTDKQVLEFTPHTAGDFQFYCAHLMYRGILTVKD